MSLSLWYKILIMEYPFQKIEHKVYKNTFLQNVRVKLCFDPIKYHENKDKQKALEAFVEDKFNLKLDDNTKNGLRIFANNMQTSLNFTENFFELMIGRKNYKSFDESVNPFLSIGLDFIRNVVGNSLNGIIIRKYDVWPYKDQKLSMECLLKSIFSKELLSNDMFNSSENKNIIQCISEKSFDIDEQIALKLKYGFIKGTDVKAKDEGQIILDSTIERDGTINVDDVDDNCRQLNQILFDSYHWAVCENIVKIMEE